MKCWYFDKKELRETPSIKDGYPLETERRYRKEGVRFILQVGMKMRLGITTIATASLYYHRFYLVRSFRNFPRFVTAACCLFLAGKTEETPKMCRDIVKVAQMCLPEEHFMHFGSNPCKEVLVLESIVLQTLNFELLVEHPHKFIVKYAKGFVGDQNKIQKIVQMAWNFVNDSMVTVLCVEWEPEIVAISLIHLSSKLSRYPITDWKEKKPEHKYWWDLYVGNVPLETFENICHQVLDIYQKAEPKPPPANPSNEMKRPIDPRELESGREMVLNAAGPMPQRLPGNVPGQAHWQRHESGYGPAATYGHGFPLDSRNRSGYDPRHDPRYDPRYDPKHDPRHDPRYDPKLDPRYDPKLDPRHDPRYDSRYDLKHDPRYDPKHDLKYDLKHDPRHVLMHDLRHDSGRDSRHDSKNDPGRISAYVHGRVPFHGYANEPVHLSQHGAQYLPSSRSGHNDEPIPSTSSAQDSKNHTSEETKAKVKHTARHYEQSTRKESSHYKGYMKNPYALGGNVAPIPHPSAFGYQPIQSSSWYHPFDPYYASAAPGSMLLSHGAAPPLPDYVPLSEAFVPPPPPEHTPAPPPPPPPPPPLPDCPPPPPPPPSSPTSPTSSQ